MRYKVRRPLTLLRLSGKAKMPAKSPLEGTEKRFGHPTKIPHLLVLIFHVFGNAVGEDVIYRDAGDAEAVLLKQSPSSSARVTVRHRAAGLSLGVISYHPI